MKYSNQKTKVGIYLGGFDPFHVGNIEFAERAAAKFGLRKVYFLVEPTPHKLQGVKALEHREAMVRLAIGQNDKLGIIQVEQSTSSIAEVLPRLRSLFAGADLCFLMGGDVLSRLSHWPKINDLPDNITIIAGAKFGMIAEARAAIAAIQKVRSTKFRVLFVTLKNQHPTAGQIRLNLRRGRDVPQLSPEVIDYIEQNNLYLTQDNGAKTKEGDKA